MDGLHKKIIFTLVLISINVLLIMIIWNKVIIKKFPKSDIQELGFFDALAISVFMSLVLNPRCVQNFYLE